MTAVLVAALVAGSRQPVRDVMATAATPLSAAPATTTSVAPPVRLPDPSGRAVQAPASSARKPVGPTRAAGIPPVALAAYQRAASVMDAADPSCRLDWTLLAAIGQVESDHGQVDGSHLDRNGVARPAIVGPRLDGRHGTSLVRDTDGGRLDGDPHFDRAVGPMQFLPSTWAAVAVDGDDDGRRNVQDIDDASLGSAVYLCADHGDLGTRAGQRAALLRYNHSRAYGVEVMAIAHALATNGLYNPSSTISVQSASFTVPADLPRRKHHDRHPRRPSGHGHGHHRHHAGTPSTPPPTPDPTPAPTPDPTPTPGPTPSPSPGPVPTGQSQPPIIPDPLPDELVAFTPLEVKAFNLAWDACDEALLPGWWADPDTIPGLTQCLADQAAVPVDDPDLLTFVAWVTQFEATATP